MSRHWNLSPDASIKIAPRLSNPALIRKMVNSLSENEQCFRLAINDGGSDFSKEFAMAVAFHENTDRTRRRGYGLQIIKTFVDEAHHVYEPNLGNKLILTKNLRNDL
ncbi:MAG: hypothetical protein AB1656_05375 [Candidatus Omnitrophota bacterium]